MFDKELKILQSDMKVEMESMYSNHVCDLVKPPINVKSIGHKWVYKKEKEPDGSIETFKAILVAREFTQK